MQSTALPGVKTVLLGDAELEMILASPAGYKYEIRDSKGRMFGVTKALKPQRMDVTGIVRLDGDGKSFIEF